MDIPGFKAIGETRQNALLFVDSKSGEIKTRKGNFLARAIMWLQGKIRADHDLLNAEKYGAHNSFLRAIGESLTYNESDLGRAEAFLTKDILEGKPLSSRRIREVLSDLDSRSGPVERQNRMMAGYMSTRGIEIRLREKNAIHGTKFRLSAVEKEHLSHRIKNAVLYTDKEVVNVDRIVGYKEASGITNQLVDELLDRKPADGQAVVVKETPVETVANRQRTAAANAEIVAGRPNKEAEEANHRTAEYIVDNRLARWHRQALPSGDRLSQVPEALVEKVRGAINSHLTPVTYESAKAEVRAIVRSFVDANPTPALLRKRLADAKLPSEVESYAKKFITDKESVDVNSLARQVNRRTADWVLKNRLVNWYVEGLNKVGEKTKVKSGETVMLPAELVDDVAKTIADHSDLFAYPDIKVHARRLVDTHISREKRAT